ncbi:LysR family transcriptional regulator [Hoeflea poritis]|uniref:LysR family transcriptional regulator n=1 Tax=Hoeflea poritis TaxID=2993659 RepID=A0ABT4VN05_9HYPH|nr:LysR family transcriptional regulator [Hoeflea poritis]MDA4845423.1 LysR family transcriptional regulator [Hoeflea poritis]
MTDGQDILKVDFAALRTLQYVHDFGSFSKAAQRLGQNQSTVSYTIGRLREVFDDPLFVREGNGVAATDRCRVIVEHAARFLEEFQGVARRPTFDPATARGSVTISCNHWERVIVLPKLIGRMRSLSPGIHLRVLSSSAVGEEQLKRGECDILLGPVQISGEQLFKRKIGMDHYVCIMDRGNPLLSDPFDFAAYQSAKHVVVTYMGNWRPFYLDALEARGGTIDKVFELTEYGDLENCIAGTDLIATVPNRLAEKFSDRIVRRALPFKVSLEVDMFWTVRTHRSAMQKWIRELVVDAADDSLSPANG